MAGFFAQGELGPVGGRNFLHAFTASLAVFCEPRDPVPALDRGAEASAPRHRRAPTARASAPGAPEPV